MTISSRSWLARASTRPNGSATNEAPQNSQVAFVPNTVSDCNKHAVSQRVAALDQLPRLVLRRAELRLLRRVPADRGGIEQDLGALESGEPRGFGEPLVPAHQHADLCPPHREALEPEIAGGEVVLLVVERVVGDVHLAVTPTQRAVRVDDDGGVVVQARSAALEEGADHRDAVVGRGAAEGVGAGSRDGLGQVENRRVFLLAEVL